MVQSLGNKIWVKGGSIRMGFSNASNWWKNICDVKVGVGVHEVGWFKANLGHHVGNDENTSFWNDPQLDEGSSCIRFSCLFDLFVDSNITVAEMRRLGWGLTGEVGDGGGNFLLGKRSWL